MICVKLYVCGYDVVVVLRGCGMEETTTTGSRSVGGVDCRDACLIEVLGVFDGDVEVVVCCFGMMVFLSV